MHLCHQQLGVLGTFVMDALISRSSCCLVLELLIKSAMGSVLLLLLPLPLYRLPGSADSLQRDVWGAVL